MPTTRFETTIKALKDYASMKPERLSKTLRACKTISRTTILPA